MSFKFYKFCQSGLITILCSLYAVFMLIARSTDLPLWWALVICVFATIICFLPIISIFYPLIIAGYIIAAVLLSLPVRDLHFYVLLALLVLHVVRFISMLTFAYKNPQLSKEYDAAIRYGYDLSK